MSPSSSRMLTRVKAVYLYIKENETVTTAEIAEEFATTTRTAQRDLNILTYNGLVTNHKRGKWCITSKRVKMSS